jgi:hypothetical protein
VADSLRDPGITLTFISLKRFVLLGSMLFPPAAW